MNKNFPELLTQLNSMEFDYADGDGIDFEPYQQFLSEADTTCWLQAWTGNSAIDETPFLVFGQDGTGGYAAFWCVRDTEDMLNQPVVFLSSEGGCGVIAQNFYAYVWLLAHGKGPFEALEYPNGNDRTDSSFMTFAEKYAPDARAPGQTIIKNAHKEFPQFEQYIDQLCR